MKKAVNSKLFIKRHFERINEIWKIKKKKIQIMQI